MFVISVQYELNWISNALKRVSFGDLYRKKGHGFFGG